MKKATKINPTALSHLMDRGEPAIVKFYAPWCGHCTNFEEEFARVDGGGTVHVARLNADKHGGALPAAVAPHVRGFPTVLFVRGSEVKAYEGPRQASAVEAAAAAHFGMGAGWVAAAKGAAKDAVNGAKKAAKKAAEAVGKAIDRLPSEQGHLAGMARKMGPR